MSEKIIRVIYAALFLISSVVIPQLMDSLPNISGTHLHSNQSREILQDESESLLGPEVCGSREIEVLTVARCC